jgi:hypothetical protein
MMRTVKKFAWTPKIVGHKLIWLREYKSFEKRGCLIDDSGCNDCYNPLSPCDPKQHRGKYFEWKEVGRKL